MKRSAWFYIVEQGKRRAADVLWYIMYRLPDLVLVLLAVCTPVFVTVLQETVTLKPPQASGDCIRIVSTDGGAVGRRVFCFVTDFSAQWYRNLVEFPTTITADCQVVADQGEKEACENRKKLTIDHLTANAIVGAVGFAAGSRR